MPLLLPLLFFPSFPAGNLRLPLLSLLLFLSVIPRRESAVTPPQPSRRDGAKIARAEIPGKCHQKWGPRPVGTRRNRAPGSCPRFVQLPHPFRAFRGIGGKSRTPPRPVVILSESEGRVEGPAVAFAFALALAFALAFLSVIPPPRRGICCYAAHRNHSPHTAETSQALYQGTASAGPIGRPIEARALAPAPSLAPIR